MADTPPPAAVPPSFVYSPAYYCDIGAHIFPTAKFRLVAEALAARGIGAGRFATPPPADHEDLARVHAPAYLDDLLNLRWTSRTRTSELPLTEEIVRAHVLAAGGTLLAGRLALQYGAAFNLTGGFHHCFADHAEGFCYVNDVAVAIRRLQAEGAVGRAFVIDLDLHQGNGTARIFQQTASVFTFSAHQENIYPPKESSDCDIGLPAGANDEEYCRAVAGRLEPLLRRFRADIAFYLAGADPYLDDQLGGLRLTRAGLRRRDELVFDTCAALGIPVAGVLAGGYARRLADTVAIHADTCMTALRRGCTSVRQGGNGP